MGSQVDMESPQQQLSSNEYFDFTDDVFLNEIRLNELQSIFETKGDDEKIPASEIRKMWKNYLEVGVEPSGWQGIWQPSRFYCDKLNLRFPSKLMGQIEQVDYVEHTASFTIEAIQGDETTEPPAKFDNVPLKELWVLKRQDNEALNIEVTAKVLDQYRFFYNHVWMPWDLSADDDGHFPLKIESRVKFYCDLSHGKLNKALHSLVRHMLTEAQYLQAKKEEIEAILENEGEENTAKKEELMRLNYRLTKIANEIDIIENPVLRKLYEKMKFDLPKECITNSGSRYNHMEDLLEKNSNFVVCPTGHLSDIVQSLKLVNERVSSVVTIKNSFKDLLESCCTRNDVYVLPGEHILTHSEYIYQHGNYLSLEQGAIIGTKFTENTLFSVYGNISFTNLTFDCSNVQNGIIVQGGDVCFEKCTFKGNKTKDPIGLFVEKYGKAHVRDCTFIDCSSGIFVNFDGTIHVDQTTFDNCNTGINLSTESSFSISDSKILNYTDAGIYVEVASKDKDCVVRDPGNDEMSKITNIVTMENVDFGDKTKNKVVARYNTEIIFDKYFKGQKYWNATNEREEKQLEMETFEDEDEQGGSEDENMNEN